jgi:16S rRNA (adenine1518-N6/adenine1519-N6)-dimethyltransferase
VQTLTEMKRLLEERGLAPRKSLGQNFLIDQNLVRKLVDASGVALGDVVLEVGPGTGTLTEELLARGCEVVACELDRGLAQLLRDRLVAPKDDPPGRGRLTLVEGDCLESKRSLNPEILSALADRPFKLVANLPYGAATPLITTLLTTHRRCPAMYVTVQREVADRLVAAPGSKDYGPLGVIVGASAEVRFIAALPRDCFWPRPLINSAMVAVTRREKPVVDDLGALAAVCQKVFGQRRKQLGSILGRDRDFPAGIRAEQRAEELSVEQLAALSKALAVG